MERVRAELADFWRRARDRGPASFGRAIRLSVAATAAYGAALAATADRRPVTAALTALLIVQVTLVGTLTDTARRILSVLAGVGIALTVSAFVPFTWWSLGGVVAMAMLVGQALRLGDHLLEVPISAMLILAAGGAGTQATDRVLETIVGAAVGLLVNVVVPPSTRTGSAGQAVQHYAHRVAEVLHRSAEAMAERPPSREQAIGWLDDVRRIGQETAGVDRVLTEAKESRRLNPRAVGTADPVPDLRTGLDALEHSAVALRAVFRSIAEGASGSLPTQDESEPPEESDDEQDRRQAIAELLRDLARSIEAFGVLVRSEAERTGGARTDELAEALDSVREARARITELLLVNPGDALGLWQLRGSLLAGIERVVAELDIEEWARRRERHRRETAAVARRGAQAAARLRTSTRRVLDENPAFRPVRRRPPR
ncbi:MAG TPA: FUSC family protein [Gaiellales bacterium]|nr:FUSC family protein [Gaiellales bacterium]